MAKMAAMPVSGMPYMVKSLKISSLGPNGQNDDHWVTCSFFYRKAWQAY